MTGRGAWGKLTVFELLGPALLGPSVGEDAFLLERIVPGLNSGASGLNALSLKRRGRSGRSDRPRSQLILMRLRRGSEDGEVWSKAGGPLEVDATSESSFEVAGFR